MRMSYTRMRPAGSPQARDLGAAITLPPGRGEHMVGDVGGGATRHQLTPYHANAAHLLAVLQHAAISFASSRNCSARIANSLR